MADTVEGLETSQANSVPTPQTPSEIARRWISEVEIAEKDQREYHVRAKQIIKRYKSETSQSELTRRRRFAILYSNIQTLAPAVYARTPQAIVSRRFKDEDPVGRYASEVLERAIGYSIEDYDFDGKMRLGRDSYLLVGRGQMWVRYEPHMKTVRTPVRPILPEVMEDGPEITTTVDPEAYEDATGKRFDPKDVKHDGEAGPHIEEQALDYEQVCHDFISWDDFLTNPARTWEEVRWVARRVYMSRGALVARFGQEIGNKVPLDWIPAGANKDNGKDEAVKKGAVYEIWDKEGAQVIWISKGVGTQPLDNRKDPWGRNDATGEPVSLDEFFPCPRPMTGTCGPDSIIPVPDFIFYQDQANEIDDLTAKIGDLEKAIRVLGFYAGEREIDLQKLFAPGANMVLQPVDSMSTLKDDGGVKGIIDWFPIDIVVSALKACIETRRQLIEDVREITGIADIMRGSSDPNETATAQGIKEQWGSLRVRDRQTEIARFARDVLRIEGEVIASKFSIDTFKAMTGVKLLTNEEKAQIEAQLQAQAQRQMAMAQMGHNGGPPMAGAPQQAPGAPPQPQSPMQPPPPPQLPPEIADMMARPSWENVVDLLRNKALRQFRIDIETDSTVEPNQQQDKALRVEFIGALGEFLAKSLPVVQASPQSLPIVMEGLKFLVRGFRVGREMEDVIDKTADAIIKAAQQPQPAAGADPAAMAKVEVQREANQIKAAQVQGDQQESAVQLAVQQSEAQAENARTAAEAQTRQTQAAVDQHTAMADTVIKAEELNLRRQIAARPTPLSPAGY